MRLPVPSFGLVLISTVLLLGMAGEAQSSFEPPTTPRVAATVVAPPDTLQSSATVGTPFIRSLPNELNDTPVTGYAVLRGPSLSGVAGHSLIWIPRGVSPGTYDVHLRADHPEASPDTLVVRIEVQS